MIYIIITLLLRISVIADIVAAEPECGSLGHGDAGVAWLHQLVCILSHMVGRLPLHATYIGYICRRNKN